MLSVDPQLLTDVEALMNDLAAERASVLTGIVHEHLATGGKRLRARLALAAVEAFGGRAGSAVGWAAACELLHNATLIHDDIEDGDTVRRGAPTVWARHGVGQALNAGDLLFVLPFVALQRLAARDDVRCALTMLLARHAADIIHGQGRELLLTAERRLDGASYLEAARGKTSGLFALPVVGAAVLVGEAGSVDVLSEAFSELGVIFQMQDDVLDCFGEKGRKRRGSDIAEGKVSALVVAHIAKHPNDHPWLAEILAQPREQTSDAAIEAVIRRFRDGGALAAVLADIGARRRTATEWLRARPHAMVLFESAVSTVLEPLGQVSY